MKGEKVWTIVWKDGTVRGTVSKAAVRAAMEKLGGEVVSVAVDVRPTESKPKAKGGGSK